MEDFIKMANQGLFDSNHPQKSVSIDNFNFTVDELLYNLIIKLWNNKIQTKFSCQGDKYQNNNAYITFLNKESMLKFFEICPNAINNVKIDIIKDGNISFINLEEINNITVKNTDLLSIRFDPNMIKIFEEIIP